VEAEIQPTAGTLALQRALKALGADCRTQGDSIVFRVSLAGGELTSVVTGGLIPSAAGYSAGSGLLKFHDPSELAYLGLLSIQGCASRGDLLARLKAAHEGLKVRLASHHEFLARAGLTPGMLPGRPVMTGHGHAAGFDFAVQVEAGPRLLLVGAGPPGAVAPLPMHLRPWLQLPGMVLDQPHALHEQVARFCNTHRELLLQRASAAAAPNAVAFGLLEDPPGPETDAPGFTRPTTVTSALPVGAEGITWTPLATFSPPPPTVAESAAEPADRRDTPITGSEVHANTAAVVEVAARKDGTDPEHVGLIVHEPTPVTDLRSPRAPQRRAGTGKHRALEDPEATPGAPKKVPTGKRRVAAGDTTATPPDGLPTLGAPRKVPTGRRRIVWDEAAVEAVAASPESTVQPEPASADAPKKIPTGRKRLAQTDANTDEQRPELHGSTEDGHEPVRHEDTPDDGNETIPVLVLASEVARVRRAFRALKDTSLPAAVVMLDEDAVRLLRVARPPVLVVEDRAEGLDDVTLGELAAEVHAGGGVVVSYVEKGATPRLQVLHFLSDPVTEARLRRVIRAAVRGQTRGPGTPH